MRDLTFVISFDASVDLLQDPTSDGRLLRAGVDRAGTGSNQNRQDLYDAI